MTPYQEAGFNELTLFRVVDSRDCGRVGQIVWIEEDDGTDCPVFNSAQERHQCPTFQRNLTELPKDADGFYLWEGGDMPVPGDWIVDVELNKRRYQGTAGAYDWSGTTENITAFKPISRPDMPKAKPVAEPEHWTLTELAPLKKDMLTMARELQAMLPEGGEIVITKDALEYTESNKFCDVRED